MTHSFRYLSLTAVASTVSLLYKARSNFLYQPVDRKAFHRIVDLWNILPVDIRTAYCTGNFKSKVKKFLMGK